MAHVTPHIKSDGGEIVPNTQTKLKSGPNEPTKIIVKYIIGNNNWKIKCALRKVVLKINKYYCSWLPSGSWKNLPAV